MNIRRGSGPGRGPQTHKGSLRWSYGKGYSYTDRIKGDYRDLEAMFPVLTRTYDELELTQEGDGIKWQILATYGGDEDPIHTYRIAKVSLQQSVFFNPRNLAGVGTITNLTLVRACWERILAARTKSAIDDAWADSFLELADAMSNPEYTYAVDLLIELNRDITSFLTTSYIFNHQVLLSRRDTNMQANYDNVDKVYSLEQMLQEEQYPDASSSVPGKPQWLKQAPDVEYTLGQRKMISTEYLAADIWSPLNYARYGEV